MILTGCLALLSAGGCGRNKQDPVVTDIDYDSFVDQCRAELRELIAASVEKWKLDEFKHFDFNQEKGQLVFSEGVGQNVVCEVQIIGTFSNDSKTWLWAWDSRWTLDHLKRDAKAVRDYGSQHGLNRLTTPKWSATEADGWDMTAIAAHVVHAEGAYRLPDREVLIFMLLKTIKESEGK
jgi:hypothetical protein